VDKSKDKEITSIKELEKLNINSVYIIGGCNTLAQVDDKLIGDPLEKSSFNAIEWEIDTKSNAYQVPGGRVRIQNHRKFLFDSSLKRMTTISTVKSNKNSEMKVLCKGAPEVLQDLLSEIPENYAEYYSYYVKHGYRVIAMAHKDLPAGTNAHSLSRESAESNLVFAGFLIFQCPMKEDTLEHITKIKDAE